MIKLVVGSGDGHCGNSKSNTLIEVDKGGTCCLTLDVSKNYWISKSDNKFDIKVNGVVVDTVTAGSDGKVQLSFDLAAGANKIEFLSKSGVSGYGAGIDNIQLNQVITTTPPIEMVQGRRDGQTARSRRQCRCHHDDGFERKLQVRQRPGP